MSQKNILLLLLTLVLGASAFWLWNAEKASAPVVKEPTPGEVSEPNTPSNETDPIDTSDWKTYRNEEIGIQFEYPGVWGDINTSKEVGCIDYYAEEVVIPKKVKDSCLHISLSASNFKNGVFLSTEGIDFTNTDIPKGVDWSFRIVSISKELEDFCSNNPYLTIDIKKDAGGQLEDCKTFTTPKGLNVTKGTRYIPFAEAEKMTTYFIRTNHPVYYDLVLASLYLESPNTERDLAKLIDTIELLKVR